MAVPKRKHSKSRTKKRQAKYKAASKKVISCSNCGAPTLPHRICDECGHYRGQLVIEKDII